MSTPKVTICPPAAAQGAWEDYPFHRYWSSRTWKREMQEQSDREAKEESFD